LKTPLFNSRTNHSRDVLRNLKKTTFYISTILLLISFSSFSQQGFERKNLNDDYNWNNSTKDERNQYYFDVEPIVSSKSKYHFRYEKSSQIVDLYSNDGIDFNGQIVNYIQEKKEVKTDYGKELRAFNYLSEKSEISKIEASKAGRLILDEKSFSIPTDSLIPNWSFGWTDCGAINFDYKVNGDFYRKRYVCAKNQRDSLKYVVRIKKLTDTISQITGLKDSYDKFSYKLPKGKSYVIDGWITMYKMSDEQIAYRKETEPIRDYQKSIKDTIDNYLEFELNRLIPNSAELDCFDDYRLTFNKNGSLKSMKVNMGFWERMFDKDYKKCRRVLKKTFKEIRIDFVDPKYIFYRGLSFGGKEIYITDPTLY
jgi:hypothetical protein